MTKLKIGIIAALIAGLITLGWLYRSELREGARQAAEIVQQQAEIADRDERIDDLAAQREAERKIAAEWQARHDSRRQEIRGLRNEIDRLEREVEDVRRWADTDMPDDIVHLLRPETDGVPD